MCWRWPANRKTRKPAAPPEGRTPKLRSQATRELISSLFLTALVIRKDTVTRQKEYACEQEVLQLCRSALISTIAGYEAMHMIGKGQACWSAAGAKVGLLHSFILDLFAATS